MSRTLIPKVETLQAGFKPCPRHMSQTYVLDMKKLSQRHEKMSQRHQGHILEISGPYLKDIRVRAISQRHQGHILEISGPYLRDIRTLSQRHQNIILETSEPYLRDIRTLSQRHYQQGTCSLPRQPCHSSPARNLITFERGHIRGVVGGEGKRTPRATLYHRCKILGRWHTSFFRHLVEGAFSDLQMKY